MLSLIIRSLFDNLCFMFLIITFSIFTSFRSMFFSLCPFLWLHFIFMFCVIISLIFSFINHTFNLLLDIKVYQNYLNFSIQYNNLLTFLNDRFIKVCAIQV